MKKYLLPKTGNFYKANLHCHSNISDGQNTPEELKKLYQEQGYSIIAYTDHDAMIPHPELCDENFLALTGYEIEINASEDAAFRHLKSCHICLIALEPEQRRQVCYHRSKYLFGNAPNYRHLLQYDENEPDYERIYTHECISDIMRKGRENGFFVTYNHPVWSLENYNDYIGYNHMPAMEIFNTGSFRIGFPEYNEKEYDDMLRAGKQIYCIAADDTHEPGDLGGGFTMIKAENLEYQSITDALVSGNFYASCGPEIYELWFEDDTIHITCSDVKRISLVTDSRRAESKVATDGETIHSAQFPVHPDDKYIRITLTDKNGNHANTNAYFTDTLFQKS